MPSVEWLAALDDASGAAGNVAIVLGALNLVQTVLITWLTLRYEANARSHPRRRATDGRRR